MKKNLGRTLYSRHKGEKGNIQWWSCQSNYHQNQLFTVTPTNIIILEITSLLQASDSGKRLCTHLLMFDITHHFMNSTCINCRILMMALCSPPFTQLFGWKWERRCANSGLFWTQPRAPPSAGGFSSFIFVVEKLIFKISNGVEKISTLTTSPPFPRLLGQK